MDEFEQSLIDFKEKKQAMSEDPTKERISAAFRAAEETKMQIDSAVIASLPPFRRRSVIRRRFE